MRACGAAGSASPRWWCACKRCEAGWDARELGQGRQWTFLLWKLVRLVVRDEVLHAWHGQGTLRVLRTEEVWTALCLVTR